MCQTIICVKKMLVDRGSEPRLKFSASPIPPRPDLLNTATKNVIEKLRESKCANHRQGSFHQAVAEFSGTLGWIRIT